ncbi:MAG: RecX family transcriptional regulator [Acholeplasmatales bacterium]|jgi:DNA-binding MarR family transcriptional regulator|nr:RecX family transcriptional regulator [Acholeplasmatales bacterium]
MISPTLPTKQLIKIVLVQPLKNCVNLGYLIDDQILFQKINYLTFYKYNLHEEDFLDKKDFKLIVAHSQEEDSYEWLLKKMKSPVLSEIAARKLLQQLALSTSLVNKIIKRLKKAQLINDQVAMKDYFSHHYQQMGPFLMAEKLYQRGFSKERVAEFMETCDKKTWLLAVLEYNSIDVNHSSYHDRRTLLRLGWDEDSLDWYHIGES